MAPTAGTYRLAPDFQGCGHSDPDHSYEGGRVEFNGGKCDGWLLAGDNDAFAIGYYTKKDLAFLSGAATRWTVGDRYFSAIMAGTFANRIYQHAAQTDRLANVRAVYPANHLGSAGLGRRGRALLLQRPSVPGALGPTLPGHRPSDRAVLLDAAAGTLPAVSFLEPRFLGEEVGASNDDHPFADLRNGQAFMNAVYTAATTGPAWRDTVFVINYDEWAASSTTCPRPRRRFPPRIRSRATRMAGSDSGRPCW